MAETVAVPVWCFAFAWAIAGRIVANWLMAEVLVGQVKQGSLGGRFLWLPRIPRYSLATAVIVALGPWFWISLLAATARDAAAWTYNRFSTQHDAAEVQRLAALHSMLPEEADA